MKESLEAIVARNLSLDAAAVNDQTGPSTVPKWTSLIHVKMMAEVEKNYGVRFAIDEIIQVKSVLDLKNLLAAKSIDVAG